MSSYRDLVMRTANWDLSTRDQFANAALGLMGEAAEAAELVKKWLYQGHEFDRERLLRELGDVRWYMELALVLLATDMATVEHLNRVKLETRYLSGGFTREASVARVDESPAAPGQVDADRPSDVPVAALPVGPRD